MAFKINSIFNSTTLSMANDSHKVIYVNRQNISENPHNKEIYSTENIELLSYGIEDKGLLEPIIVSVLEKGSSPENTKYQIGNLFNRDKSEAERAKELELKKKILETRRKKGERVPGKLLELIAGDMKISAHQAKKLDSINRNASEAVKTAFEQGSLSTDAAYEFSRTDKATQDEALRQLADEPSKTAKAVRTAIRQEQNKKPKPPKETKTPKPTESVPNNREVSAYLSRIIAKLEKITMTNEQAHEMNRRLSAIEDYLDQIKTV